MVNIEVVVIGTIETTNPIYWGNFQSMKNEVLSKWIFY
jgi:hypothetical protein